MLKSSYSPGDVDILLKDITGLVEPLPASVREVNIQSGIHYCEMLPLEYKPSDNYMRTYENALQNYAKSTAIAVGVIAEKLFAKKGKDLVLVSLARAGIPIGVLIRRYIINKYKIQVQHYAISIIRGRGIDKNAMDYILRIHNSDQIQFVDGWIGKGAILTQLKEALLDYPGVSSDIAVVSDPANLTDLCGTHEDILIASSCLNATVTGLISRTFLRSDIIGPSDFHGAAFYETLKDQDLSLEFVQRIEKEFVYDYSVDLMDSDFMSGPIVVAKIAEEYGIDDINFIKPGIGETTRVLLRRVPWKIIINEKYKSADELRHIYQLAAEKNVTCEISRVNLGNYKVCGIIKKLSDI